jgi:2,3-bisphosphoglycerate-independent phosphoglycerate mutase
MHNSDFSELSDHVLFLFIDGVGVAPASDTNPLVQAATPVLQRILGGALTAEGFASARGAHDFPVLAHPIDARLGLPGLPQSGTGQCTLMTGENCSALHGTHFGPYPPSTIRPLLHERNIYSRIAASGRPIDFANAFPTMYFERIAKRPVMMPTIASSFIAAGRSLRTATDLRDGNAISAEMLNARWKEMGHTEIEPITMDVAGKRLAHIVGNASFSMFEYWLTDKAGHAQDIPMAIRVTEAIDGLLGAFLNYADMRNTTSPVITATWKIAQPARTR